MSVIIRIINIIVFLAATLAIAGVFYEGMVLKWFSIVGVLILVMDFSFVVSIVFNLIYFKKSNWLKWMSIISLSMILIAIFMKIFSISYPIWGLVVWYFYIWFYYGFLI